MEKHKKHIEWDCKSYLTSFCVNVPQFEFTCCCQVAKRGETFVDQQNGYDSRYTFSAKEKDDETQYSYFGARYYDSDLSVWLSVDPMSDMYPSTSGYMYVLGNPLNLVDPTGMNAWLPPTDGSGNWTAEAGDCVYSLASDAGISVDRAYELVGEMNANRGESNSEMVHPGDKVSTGTTQDYNLGFTIVPDNVETPDLNEIPGAFGEFTFTNEGATETLLKMSKAYTTFFAFMAVGQLSEVVGALSALYSSSTSSSSALSSTSSTRNYLYENMYFARAPGYYAQPNHKIWTLSTYKDVIMNGNMSWNSVNNTWRISTTGYYNGKPVEFQVGFRTDGGIMHNFMKPIK